MSHPPKSVSFGRRELNSLKQVATKRSMSNKRLLANGLTLSLALFLVYSSYFYFPAYYSSPTIVRVATEAGSIPDDTPQKGIIGKYIGHMLWKRGYVRAGQSVRAQYKISDGVQLKLVSNACSGIKVIEIFSCKRSNYMSKTVSDSQGAVTFDIKDSGFYHFDEVLMSLGDTNSNYVVTWVRG